MKDKTMSSDRSGRGSIPAAGNREAMANTAPGSRLGRDDAERDIAPVDVREEMTIVLHTLDGEGRLEGTDAYLRNRGIVHRAMDLLAEWKFLPARISSAKVPVDIIAIRSDMTLLVQVISSKKPIPDARALVRNYATKIDALRQMGSPLQFTKILMAYSKLCGWKYYEVLPGGLMPAWHLPDVSAS